MAGRGGFTLTLDNSGLGHVAKVNCREAIDELTEEIAENVRARVPADVEVVTDSYTTDRAAGAVVIASRRGMALQASDGVLTRAASSVGLEVTRK